MALTGYLTQFWSNREMKLSIKGKVQASLTETERERKRRRNDVGNRP